MPKKTQIVDGGLKWACRGISALKKIHSRLEGRSPFGIGRRVFRQTPVRDKRRGCLIDKQVFTEEIIRRYFERACVRTYVRTYTLVHGCRRRCKYA